MRRATNNLLAIGAIVVLTAACDGTSRSSAPLSPTAPAVVPAFTLSGVVSTATAAGVQLLEGVAVEETGSHQRATTDSRGFYMMSAVQALPTVVSARKDGYRIETRTLTIS